MSPVTQKIIFFFIIGAALALVSVIVALGPVAVYRFGPPDLTATAAALSVRTTEVALAATEAALGYDPKVMLTPGAATTKNVAWNGLQIEVLSVTQDAWSLVQAQNHNNEPPQRGKRMLMALVMVTNVESKEDKPVRVSAWDFQLIGDRRVAYRPYGRESSCGVVPDELDGVVARGQGFITGNICVQAPLEEGNFMLIYEQQAGNYPAVYINLPQ